MKEVLEQVVNKSTIVSVEDLDLSVPQYFSGQVESAKTMTYGRLRGLVDEFEIRPSDEQPENPLAPFNAIYSEDPEFVFADSERYTEENFVNLKKLIANPPQLF